MTGDRVWFVSDVHVVHGDEAYQDQFIRFLDVAKMRCRTLYLIGDIFEFWIGDRQKKLAFYRPLFTKLEELVSAGVAVWSLHGNRDFTIEMAYSEIGIELLPETVTIEFDGVHVHVSHGDQFCIEDKGYMRTRGVLRSKFARFVASLMPGFVGAFLASTYRSLGHRSKESKKRETGDRFHTIEAGLKEQFRSTAPDLIICGHIHHFAETHLVVDGEPRRVLTTGAWEEEGPNVIQWHEGQFTLYRPEI